MIHQYLHPTMNFISTLWAWFRIDPFSSDQWRPLLSLGRIRGIVFASDSPRHDTGIHKVEVVPPLSVRKGGAMVHWHCKKCKWWLGQTLR
jgi:hypothetical protein